jgi:transglutaminase/protease-like cytokinesis protein 3
MNKNIIRNRKIRYQVEPVTNENLRKCRAICALSCMKQIDSRATCNGFRISCAHGGLFLMTIDSA